MRPQRRGRQSGQAMVIFVLSFTFLVGIAALAVEGGRAESDRRFLQAMTDGAALAGAEYLNADTTASDYQPTSARQTAAKYIFNGLAGGTQAGNGPACSYSSDITPGSCDPDSTHKLTVTTPYNGHPDQILIRLDNTTPLLLGTAVGVSSVNTAARAVAQKVAGGETFPFALYVGGNLTSNGNVNLQVGGNMYIRGCIQFTNSDELVAFADNGEPGSIDVLADPNISSAIGGNSTTPQVWDQGGNNGCKANVFARDSYGQSGSAKTSTPSCGKTAAPTQFFLTCPSSPVNVTNVMPPKGFKHTDPCQSTAPTTWIAGSGPGCYNACTANAVSGSFSAGIYGFIGSTCSPGSVKDLIFTGNATGSGVSFVLTNGAGVCIQSCNAGAGTGNPATLTFTPPASGQTNEGLLFYDCSGGLLGCSSGGGQVTFKGPGAGINFGSPSLIFAPSSTCTLQANGAQYTLGQIICNDLTLQGGASSSAEQVFFGGPGLPSPLFEVSLIE